MSDSSPQTVEQIFSRDLLTELLLTMDVPKSRMSGPDWKYDDLRWLARNVWVKNRKHESLDLVMFLIRERIMQP